MYSSSLFALFTASLAAVASAYTQPQGDTPSGNPISKPGLNEVVPAGKPYDITWEPTTQGTVTLVLLRGPSTNIQPLYPIVKKIPNTGSYSWTPSTYLVPDVTHYGIKLIVDSNGQYQYTTQFGISNPNYGGSSSSSSVYASSTPATSPAVYSSSIISASSYVAASSTSCNTTTSMYATSYGTASWATGSGYPTQNSTIVRPTKHMTVPHSLKTTTKPVVTKTKTTAGAYSSVAASSTVAQISVTPSTGAAAGRVAVGMGAVLGAFAMLL
jgi:hypothetical protein